MGAKSRRKGQAGEREVVNLLKLQGWISAAHAKPGVKECDIPRGFESWGHIEIKREAKVRMPAWIRQAQEDAGDQVPMVVWREDGRPRWRLDMDFEEFLLLLKRFDAGELSLEHCVNEIKEQLL